MAVTRIEEGGLGTDSFNLPVTLNGTDGSSTHAGDNIVLDASASGVDAGERLLFEGIPPDFANISTDTSVLSGATLTIDSGATIVNSGTATGFGGSDPSSADGDSLGTASLEWSDLYLADGGIIYFGNDQDITLTHVADTGLDFNGIFQVASGTVGAPSLSFTGDPDTGLFSVGGDELGIAVGGSRPIYSTNRKVCINDDSTGNMDSGLCINQTSYDNNILELKSSDVAHGYTGVAETDTYFWIHKQHATGAGAVIAAANESGNVNAFEFRIHNDTYSSGKSTGTNCGSTFFFFDGESGDIDSNGNMLGISARRGSSNEIVFLVDEDGDIHADGSLSAFDEYDDAMLARTMQIALSEQSKDNKVYGKMIQTEFDNFVTYNKQTLIDAGLLGQTTEEESKEGHRGLINVTGMQRLHNGAIVQQRAMFETMKSVVEEMLPGFSEKLNKKLKAQSLPALPV